MLQFLVNIRGTDAVGATINNVTCGGSSVLRAIKFGLYFLKIISVFVPIILLLIIAVDFVKGIVSSEDNSMKKISSIVVKRIVFCILLFLIEPIVYTTVDLLGSNKVDFAECIEIARNNDDFSEYDIVLDIQPAGIEADLTSESRKVIVKKSKEVGESSGDGKILLVAGHSYSPYCGQMDNECRGTFSGSGYAEEVETRALVLSLKSALLSEGYDNSDIDIANELLGEDFNDNSTTKSLFVEGNINPSGMKQKINFSQYSYAIEFHFNASDAHSGSGVLSICSSNCDSTSSINSEVRSAVNSVLGSGDGGDILMDLFDLSLFAEYNVPFTYLETEHYDNKGVMDNFVAHRDEVAAAIAKVIKKNYP